VRALAGDIGGTSARLAIVEVDADGAQMVHKERFASRDFVGLAPIVQAFLAGVADVPERACFGVACPALNGRCEMTNLAWSIDGRSLSVVIGIPDTGIINDLHAVGHAVHRLSPDEVVTLQRGEPEGSGPIALVGAGTGLGEAFLTWSAGRYHAHASEGGHSGFSLRTELERGLRLPRGEACRA
jgi:glucokinase